jgi:hypothetical protein
MNKIEVKNLIYKIFDYIETAEETTEYGPFKGHPGLYFFHSKEEFDNLLNTYLKEKETYDKYDIYYIGQRLIKFLLNKYDSHTKIVFQNSLFFPIKFKVENNKLYVINITSDLNNVIGGELISINGIPIDQISKELESIICYSTKEFLNEAIASNIIQIKVLKSLPSIKNNINKITYQIKYKDKLIDITFDEQTKYNNYKDNFIQNYTYEIIDNILVIHYNSCKDKEQMNKFIKKIKLVTKNNNIEDYIVDIRNNVGGNSGIISPLIEFLTGKNIITLINERVFSSGRMALVDLKNIGSYIIGTNISTSLNAFGNIPGQLDLDDIGFIVKRSNTYWYYDKNLKCQGYQKTEFEDYFKDKKELLEPIILEPDEYICTTIDDIINNKDPQLNRAINYIKEKHKTKKENGFEKEEYLKLNNHRTR